MEISTIKVKGSEIIERWNKAKAMTEKLGSSLGEKGWYYHQHGYDVWYDGFNTCTFGCKDINLSFRSQNWYDDNKWRMNSSFFLYDKQKNDWVEWYIESKYSSRIIQPDDIYEFKQNLSLAEKFDMGIIKPTQFKVATESSRAIGEWHYFDTFEAADEYARKVCQEYIDGRFNDRGLTRYYMTSVRNNEQKAKECHELRHYSWYKIDGRDCWITVRPYD